MLVYIVGTCELVNILSAQAAMVRNDPEVTSSDCWCAYDASAGVDIDRLEALQDFSVAHHARDDTAVAPKHYPELTKVEFTRVIAIVEGEQLLEVDAT